MNKMIQTKVRAWFKELKASWKREEFLSVLKVDITSVALAVAIVALYFFVINIISISITGGLTGEQLSASMLHASAPELEQMLTKVRVLVFFMAIVGILILLLTSLIYGYSRHKVIEALNHSHKHQQSTISIKEFFKQKLYLKWLWMTIIMSVIATILYVIYIFLRYALVMIYVMFLPQEQFLWEQIAVILNVFVALLLLHVLFNIEAQLVQSKKSWSSISAGFSRSMKQYKEALAKSVTVVLMYILANFIILYPLSRMIYSPTVFIGIQLVIVVLFFSWARVYFHQKWGI